MTTIDFQFVILNLSLVLIQYSSACVDLHETPTENVNCGKVSRNFVNSKNYILHFYSIQLQLIVESEVLQFTGKKSLSEYSWLINQKHETNLDITCETYSCTEISAVLKYHRPIYIVFTTLPKISNDMVTSSPIFMNPATILIFVNFETKVSLKIITNGWLRVMFSSSIKLFSFASKDTGKTLAIHRFCAHNIQTQAMKRMDLINIFHDPNLFQKNHVWNGQGRRSVALVKPSTIGYFDKSIVKNRNACQKLINGRIARLAMLCSSIIMIPLSLGSVHNISFQMFHATSEPAQAQKAIQKSN